VDWAEAYSHFTLQMECFLIDLEKECSIEAVTRLTGVSWDQGWRVMEQAVERGLERRGPRLPERMGVDEKSFGKGHKYETLVLDLDSGDLVYVGDDRETESLGDYLKEFPLEVREKVQAVAMDMWDAYIKAVKQYIPGAEHKIVFDKYHVMQHLGQGVDEVRKEENRALLAESEQLDILKGTRYLWLYNRENIPSTKLWEFDVLRKLDLKTSRAWAIKEHFKKFWDYCHEGWAKKFFQQWYNWASHSQLKPMVKAAKMIKDHFANILTYLKHRITNACVEAMNRHIEKVKRMANGFRNRAHYRTAIYFHCGGLDLYPRKA
jgi:transposase